MEPERLTAEGSMDFEEFIDAIYVLLKAAWGEDWGVFSMNKPSITDGRDVTMPQIVYTIPKIEPGMIGTHREIKPRLRDRRNELSPITGDLNWVEIYGRVLDCQVDFIIYGANNKNANLLAKRFRQLLDTYKGALMRQGLQNLWFTKEADRNIDENSDELIAARTISYLVRIEELSRVEVATIEALSVEMQTLNEKLQLEGTLPSQQL